MYFPYRIEVLYMRVQAFLTTNPSVDAAACKSCGARMPLLAQVWCPREGAAHDRALYVWGCARARCQRAR
jgi:pre-rRNA-processing protein TSR4